MWVLLSSSSPQYKNQLIENIIQLGSRTGQFSAFKGKDTDVFIERKIVDADYHQAEVIVNECNNNNQTSIPVYDYGK